MASNPLEDLDRANRTRANIIYNANVRLSSEAPSTLNAKLIEFSAKRGLDSALAIAYASEGVQPYFMGLPETDAAFAKEMEL